MSLNAVLPAGLTPKPVMPQTQSKIPIYKARKPPFATARLEGATENPRKPPKTPRTAAEGLQALELRPQRRIAGALGAAAAGAHGAQGPELNRSHPDTP